MTRMTESSACEEAKSWQELLENFAYKSDFEIYHQYNIDYDEDLIGMELHVIDSRGSGKMIRVVRRDPVPRFSDIGEQGALKMLHLMIHALEAHEIDEQIRYRGELVFDPHE